MNTPIEDSGDDALDKTWGTKGRAKLALARGALYDAAAVLAEALETKRGNGYVQISRSEVEDLLASVRKAADSTGDGADDPVPRAEVAWFAAEIEARLRANDHKGRRGWKGMGPQEILSRICDEVAELFDAFEVEATQPPDRVGPREAFHIARHHLTSAAGVLRELTGTIVTRGNARPLSAEKARYSHGVDDAISEAADVGAFLMMLADRCRRAIERSR